MTGENRAGIDREAGVLAAFAAMCLLLARMHGGLVGAAWVVAGGVTLLSALYVQRNSRVHATGGDNE